MTKTEREYPVLWLAQDLALLLKAEPKQREAYETLVVEIMDAIGVWMGWSVLSKGVTMQWMCKALLRYRRNGTGPVAAALSDDPYEREIELALVARATVQMLKLLRPEAP